MTNNSNGGLMALLVPAASSLRSDAIKYPLRSAERPAMHVATLWPLAVSRL